MCSLILIHIMENDNPFFEKPQKAKRNWFIIILQTLVVFTAVSIILYLFVITPNEVDGPSMEPNFYTHELLLSNRITQWVGDTPLGASLGMDYKRGDVITFQKPGLKEFVKRIVGMPGDRVSVREGYLYINGEKLVEEYLPPAIFTRGGDFLLEGGEGITVPAGHYFAVGDNRPVSNDSRYRDVGFINREWIKGRVILRIFPINKFSIITTGEYSFE